MTYRHNPWDEKPKPGSIKTECTRFHVETGSEYIRYKTPAFKGWTIQARNKRRGGMDNYENPFLAAFFVRPGVEDAVLDAFNDRRDFSFEAQVHPSVRLIPIEFGRMTRHTSGKWDISPIPKISPASDYSVQISLSKSQPIGIHVGHPVTDIQVVKLYIYGDMP